MTALITSILIFALAMLCLGAGLILRRKGLRRSCCGGELCDQHGRSDEPCDDCPDREGTDPHA